MARRRPLSWHTRLERDLIEQRGGTWRRGFGVDGEIGGRPVEVRAARKDDRFRLGKDVHEELVAGDGLYIFNDDVFGTRTMPAADVSALLGPGEWFQDRDFPHKFIGVDDVFASGGGGLFGFGLKNDALFGPFW